MDLIHVLINAVAIGVTVFVASILYSEIYLRWRVKKLVSGAIKDVVNKLKSDGELKNKVSDIVSEITEKAIDKAKEKLPELANILKKELIGELPTIEASVKIKKDE